MPPRFDSWWRQFFWFFIFNSFIRKWFFRDRWYANVSLITPICNCNQHGKDLWYNNWRNLIRYRCFQINMKKIIHEVFASVAVRSGPCSSVSKDIHSAIVDDACLNLPPVQHRRGHCATFMGGPLTGRRHCSECSIDLSTVAMIHSLLTLLGDVSYHTNIFIPFLTFLITCRGVLGLQDSISLLECARCRHFHVWVPYRFRNRSVQDSHNRRAYLWASHSELIVEESWYMFLRTDAWLIKVAFHEDALPFLSLSKTVLKIEMLRSTFPFLW